MRKLLSRRKVMIGAGLLLFLLALNLISSQVRGLVIGVSSPFQSFLWQAGNGVSTFFGGGSLRVKVETLVEENLALQAEIVALEDLRRENEELRNILDLGLQEKFDFAMGEIIGKSLMQDTITIRAGKEKGVQKGMPVITAGNAAVGRVTESFATYAQVQLISAQESKLDAKTAVTQVTGVMRGQGAQKLLFDLVPQEDELQKGDIVVTSNLGDMFPENLLIGLIEEVVKSGENPFQKAIVKPFFDLRSSEFVFVITSLKQ